LRLAALWLILFAAYAATIDVPARDGYEYAGTEPHHLLAAESIVSDRDVDLRNQYRQRTYKSWYPGVLRTDGRIVGGRLVEPHGIGYALLIAPAYWLGGPRAVQAEMAFLLALAFVLGAALARSIVPEPWATAGAALAGLSPPALAASTTITPGVPAAVALTGAMLCALAVRGNAHRRYVFGGALLLASLPWLGWTYTLPGLVVAWALVVWTLRERRRLLALVAAEALSASLVFYVTLNDRFYGGFTPRAAGSADQPSFPLGYVHRIPRLASLWLDRADGLVRWAPVLALVAVAAWQLYRSRRDQLARVAPARREAEAASLLALLAIAAQLVVVAFAGTNADAFPGVPLIATLPAAAALTSWGLRHVPRLLGAALAALTLAASLFAALGPGWLALRTDAPWGPLVNVFPNFSGAPFYPALACAALAAGVAALIARERRDAGEWRRAVAASRPSRALH
jgi:hypothetical protein